MADRIPLIINSTAQQIQELPSGDSLTGITNIAATGNITGGTLTSTGNIVVSDGGNIGSASDTDAIAIASSGNVTLSQNLTVTGNLTVSGTTTTVNSTTVSVADPIFEIGDDSSDDKNLSNLIPLNLYGWSKHLIDKFIWNHQKTLLNKNPRTFG